MGEVKAVADMHQRKAEMARHSDAFIALPGSYYTILLFFITAFYLLILLDIYIYACFCLILL